MALQMTLEVPDNFGERDKPLPADRIDEEQYEDVTDY